MAVDTGVKILSELNIKIRAPKIEILNISVGEYDVQKFIYHFIMKYFWNNVRINYHWYHPEDCSRHTFDEVQTWFKDNNLNVVHEYIDEYGIIMGGKKI